MHRHLVERNPFELHVASNADFADGLLVRHTPIRLPYPLQRLKKAGLVRNWPSGLPITKIWSGR